ncbi:DMT family transporter, partial [Amylibacter sp.]|nr:DMT family transporter [Amylibacter sp.]
RPDNVQLGFGHLAALGAAFSGATASVIMRKIGKDERLVVLMIYPMLITFFVMAIALQFNYRPMPIEDMRISFLISMLGLIATLFVIASYREGEAAIVAPMQYSQIIWASIFGYYLFGEQINSSMIIGTVIIIASGLYIVIRESGSNSKNTPVLRTRSRELGSGLRVGAMLRAIRKR